MELKWCPRSPKAPPRDLQEPTKTREGKIKKCSDKAALLEQAVMADVINVNEKNALLNLEKLITQVIAVDEFEPVKGNEICKKTTQSA